MLLAVGLLSFGCDPSFAVVAVNSSDEPMLVGRIGISDEGVAMRDVVESPIGSRIRLASMYIDWWPRRIVVLSESCDVLADTTLDSFAEGGSVLIRGRDDIEFRPGGHPGGEVLPTTTARCVETLGRLTPSPPGTD